MLKTMLSNYVEALLKGKDEQKEKQRAEGQVSIQDEEPIEDAMNAEEETFEIVDISFSMVGRSLKYLNQTQSLFKMYDFFHFSKAKIDSRDKESEMIKEMVDENQYTKRKFSLEYFNVRRT